MKKLIYSQEDLDLILSLELDKLQSNWNSLREWLENNEDDTFTAKVIYDVVLDKMNELEGKDKE